MDTTERVRNQRTPLANSNSPARVAASKPYTIATVRPDAHHDMARRETLDSLLDGRAKWPDGRPREIGIPLYERVRLKALADTERESAFNISAVPEVLR